MAPTFRTLMFCTMAALSVAASTAAQPLVSARETPPPPPLDTERVAAQLATAEASLDAVEARLASLAARQGRWSAGDASGPFTVYLDGGVPRLIDERLDMGDYGSSRNRYLLDDGALVYYREDRDARVLAGAAEGSMSKVVTRLVLDDDGTLAAWEKRVDGALSALSGYEARAAAERATTLLGEVGVGTARGPARVTGTVTYRQRVALSPTAVVIVRLEDVSRMDAAATPIVEQTIPNPGQVPIAFSLEYDPAQIDPGHTYAVRVRIEDGGRLRFVSTTQHAVITRGRPATVDIIVEPVG